MSKNATDIDREFDIRGLTALLVEDAWIVGAGIQSALTNMGVVISNPVATAGEARALLDAVTFDVAIVDLNLRDERADGLIADLKGREIPVVVVSGGEVPSVVAAQARAVLPKPLRFNALLGVLRTIDRRAAA